MKKPFIGLCPSHNLETNDLAMRYTYLDAVAHGGGIPLVLPLKASREDLAAIVEKMDGIILIGGPDIHPFRFHEETHAACGEASLIRDELELTLLSVAMEQKKPILGVCRGVQLINVGLGGTLYQDLKSQWKEEFPIAHDQPFEGTVTSHTVEVLPDTLLSNIIKKQKIEVNSFHHQAIKDLAPGLKVCGYAPNHLIEAVELPDYPFLLGVQWHPEYLFPVNEDASKIFTAFVDVCRKAE